MKKHCLVICLMIFVFLSGCFKKQIAHFTIVSTKNIDISGKNNYEEGQKVEGKDMSFWNMGSIGSALTRALDKDSKAVALEDVNVYYKWNFFTTGYEVEGTVLKVK